MFLLLIKTVQLEKVMVTGSDTNSQEYRMVVHSKIKSFIVVIALQCTILYISYMSLKNVYPTLIRQLELSSNGREHSLFVCPEERERFDWKAILEPCKLDMEWQYRSFGHKAVKSRTSAKESLLVHYERYPSGYYSKFVFQSRTSDGKNKSTGGDYWRAYLTGKAWITGFVKDLNDGMYEVWFLITEPGNYELNLLLEYSLCEGLRDPPLGWFERGNIHGRFQQEGILGYVDDFLQDNVALLQFSIEASLNATGNKTVNSMQASNKGGGTQIMFTSNVDAPCFAINKSKHKCELVWNGYGRWKRQSQGYTWLPNFPESEPADYSTKEKLETLWFLGDSLTYRLWDSSYTRVLCRKAFKECKKTYMWVYDVGTYGEHKTPNNVGLAFNFTRFFEPLNSILNKAEMKSNRSVIIINFGLHLVMSLNFSEYRSLINQFATTVSQHRLRSNRSGIPQFIWKTTTLSHKENTKRWNMTQARFLTNHRISLFNAYANARLCTAGFTILDIFPISASFPEGSRDHVHYHYYVFEPAEEALASYLWRTYNK